MKLKNGNNGLTSKIWNPTKLRMVADHSGNFVTFSLVRFNPIFWAALKQSETRFTLEEIVPYSWWIRNVLVPNWFSRLHTRGRIRNENIPVWSLLRRFWIWNIKKELGIRKLLIPESFFRVNVFLSNSDIFPPAIMWVCGITKMADPVIQSNPKW